MPDYEKLQRLMAQAMVILLRDCSIPVARDIEAQLLRELTDDKDTFSNKITIDNPFQ